MSDHFRNATQQDSLKDEMNIEELSRSGLTLPVYSQDNRDCAEEALTEVFANWVAEASAHLQLIRGAIILTDCQLHILASYTGGDVHPEIPLQVGASWHPKDVGATAVSKCAESGTSAWMRAHDHESKPMRLYSSAAIPVYSGSGVCCGFLVLIAEPALKELSELMLLLSFGLSFQYSAQLGAELMHSSSLSLQKQQSDKEAKKRDVLFQAARKLHSKIDVDSVLTEVVDSIHHVYPNVQVDMLLSQDSHSTSLRVKPFKFQSHENDICTRAFMEGQLIFEPGLQTKETCRGRIAAPLSGKQGVYGVLFLQSEWEIFDQTDIQFISMLADTAGSAFENAKLYEHSNLLIDELRLINEITKRLNQSLRLNEIFNFASTELLKIFKADYCLILQTDPDKQKLTVQSGNLAALHLHSIPFDEGFSGLIYSTKEPLIISDYWTNTKVKSKLMKMTNSRSLIASPIMVNEEVVGVILIVHSMPNFFSYDNYKLLQVLSSHIGLAMTNASLHAEVRRMVITDNLTGLYVRHYLDEQVNIMQKKDLCGSLILVDIDNFKRINDTFGHQIGDKILIQVSGITKSSIRDSDIAARWGGEELAVYLPQVQKEQTVRIAERIRTHVLMETNPQVTVSCGVSDWHWEEDKISVEALFYKADMALYQAKHNGRNQIKVG